MQYLGVIFAVLGVGLQLRMWEGLLDSMTRAQTVDALMAEPMMRRVLTVGFCLIPFLYYGVCIYASINKHRTTAGTWGVLAVLGLAVAYFGYLYGEFPSFGRNAFWAGLFSYSAYFSRARVGQSEEPLEEGNSDLAQPIVVEDESIGESVPSDNPYAPPKGL